MDMEDKALDELEYLLKDGEAAKELLANPSFHKFVEELKAHYGAAFFNTALDEPELREELHRRNIVLDDLISTVKTAAARGEAAKEALKSQENEVEQ